jgi:hypothetical protein
VKLNSEGAAAEFFEIPVVNWTEDLQDLNFESAMVFEPHDEEEKEHAAPAYSKMFMFGGREPDIKRSVR